MRKKLQKEIDDHKKEMEEIRERGKKAKKEAITKLRRKVQTECAESEPEETKGFLANFLESLKARVQNKQAETKGA